MRESGLLQDGDTAHAAVTCQANYNDVFVIRQFAQPVLQLVQRNQGATGNMELIPFFLAAHVQEERALLILCIRLGRGDFHSGGILGAD